jgi:hypothetical protein
MSWGRDVDFEAGGYEITLTASDIGSLEGVLRDLPGWVDSVSAALAEFREESLPSGAEEAAVLRAAIEIYLDTHEGSDAMKRLLYALKAPRRR